MAGTVVMRQLGRLGRFGNQLFQISGILGVARKNNMDFAFSKWENTDHRERFGSSEDCDIQKFFENELPILDENKSYMYQWINWGYHDIRLNTDVNYDLCGHFQSEKYFSHCMDEVRHFLKMKDEYPLQENVCAVHVRLGDYDDKYHPRQTMEYYSKAMAQIPGVKFMVFSDDIEACKKMFGDKVEYSEGNDYIEDFKVMKSCNHFITGNSSYSLMAAMLCEASNKKVVCPANWFGPSWGSGYREMSKDIYPENSIVI